MPLAIEFARGGLRVVGIDVNGEKVEAINAGHSYVLDVPDAAVTEHVSSGVLRATTDFSVLSDTDAVCICVPTPLTKTMDPDISYIVDAVERVREHLHRDMLVVLESTTYPGTTDELVQQKLEESGLKVGVDFYLAFSPERVDPGNAAYTTRNTPKVIGGVTPACTARAAELYRHAIDTVVPVSSSRAAEMVKLLENTFRAINIGLVNELAIMCGYLDVDVWEVIDAAKTKPFGFMPFYPGPGLGGHCIPIDPLYLSWKLKSMNYNARFIELATAVNTGMPEYVATKIADALNKRRKSVNGSRILAVGVAYKADVSDTRESPALDIISILRGKGAEVSYLDPYVDRVEIADRPVPRHESGSGFAQFDLVAILTPHTFLDIQAILDQAPLVYDARNATKDCRVPDTCTVVKL